MSDPPDGPPTEAATAATEPSIDLGRLSRRFGLPPVHVVSYHHGATGAWRLTDGRGTYSLKLTAADAPGWALDALRANCEFEWDAYQAGVAMPEPLRPLDSPQGLTALIDGHYAVLHRWIDNAGPCGEDERIGAWLGSTLATLHRVAPAAPHADLTNRYGLHPLSEWRQWALDAEAADLPWAAAATARLPLVAELRPFLNEAVECWQHTSRLVHGDISRSNVLIAPEGPMLCDFDATPDLPWMEAVHVAVSFGEPDASVLASYLEAGGAPGPMSVVALASSVGAALNWTAYNMWISLGHRPVPTWRVDEATRRVPQLWAHVDNVAGRLEQTASALFSGFNP